MALSKLVAAASLLVSILLLHVGEAAFQKAGLIGSDSDASSPLIDCAAACDGRCSQSKRPRLCNRSCGSCCARCHCVPPGTYGNLSDCPCYASLTTRRSAHKCP